MRPLHRTSAPRIRESEDARGASGGVPSSGVEGVPSDRTQLRKAPLPVVEPLGPEDIEILRLESPTVAGHALKIAILDPVRRGPRPDAEALRARIADRIERAPRLRCKLHIGAGRRAAAAWVDDAGFDVRKHVRPLPVAEPVSEDELRRIVARVMEERLDRSRPLWTIDVLDRLEDGGTTIIWKIHHAIADGVTAMRFAEEVLWTRRLTPGTSATASAATATPSGEYVRRGPRGARGAQGGASPAHAAAGAPKDSPSLTLRRSHKQLADRGLRLAAARRSQAGGEGARSGGHRK